MWKLFAPEVRTINQGLRNVDHRDFSSPEQVTAFLRDYDFLDSGMEALILKSRTEPDIILRIELYNPLGKGWTISLLNKLAAADNNPQHQERYRDALSMLNSAGELYTNLAQSAQKRVLERVAAHNAQYKHDPASTIPINLIYSFRDVPFAVRMKYLNGEAAVENADALERQIGLTGDGNPHNTLTGIKNSPHHTQLLDLKHFIASRGFARRKLLPPPD